MKKYVAALAAALTTAVSAVTFVGTTTQSASAGSFGSIQVVCRPSHTNHDDPIVFPRQPGAAHQHEFFGNTSTNAGSTLTSLTGKPTTCSRPGDTAAYWTPAVFNNGRRVAPDRLIAYYRTTRIQDITSVKPFPRGLKMIAGSAMATAASPQPVRFVNWGCGDGVEGTAKPPTSCPSGQALRLRIEFPGCWNGRTLDSADHKSHMAYAGVGGVRGCPSSHRTDPGSWSARALGRYVSGPARDPGRWSRSRDLVTRRGPQGAVGSRTGAFCRC